MSCEFCITYQESSTRTPEGRFCFQTRKLVQKNHEPCYQLVLGTNFWCSVKSCWLCPTMCVANQRKTDVFGDTCKKCSKKKAVLEVRKFAGRAALKRQAELTSNNHTPTKIIRRSV